MDRSIFLIARSIQLGFILAVCYAIWVIVVGPLLGFIDLSLWSLFKAVMGLMAAVAFLIVGAAVGINLDSRNRSPNTQDF